MTTTYNPNTDLIAGAAWPTIQLDDVFLHGDERPWVPMAGFEGAYVKMLMVNKERGLIAYLFNMPPFAVFPMHEHVCTAIAYTLKGNWHYGEFEQREGSIAVESPGSTHAPATEETGFTALSIFIATPEQNTFLRVQDRETLEVFELDWDYFADLYAQAGDSSVTDETVMGR